MTLEEKVKARIVELKAGLDQYIKDADKQIAMYQVSIAELQLLIKPEPVPEPAIVPFNEPFPGTTGTAAGSTSPDILESAVVEHTPSNHHHNRSR